MKKYTKPAVEIEKFTVVDVITDSETTTVPTEKPGQDDMGGFGGNSVGLEINDEF